MKVPFPGIGNSLKLEVPVIITSGITKPLAQDPASAKNEPPLLDLPPYVPILLLACGPNPSNMFLTIDRTGTILRITRITTPAGRHKSPTCIPVEALRALDVPVYIDLYRIS